MWISTRLSIYHFVLSSVVFHTDKKILNVCGPQIRRLRSQKGWSQPQLAAKCQLAGWDISRDIVARIELQIRWIGDFELKIIADVLDVSLEELYPIKSRKKCSHKK